MQDDKDLSSLKALAEAATRGPWTMYRGEICYKSDADDQSYGMLCPVDLELDANAGLIEPQTAAQERELNWFMDAIKAYATLRDDADLKRIERGIAALLATKEAAPVQEFDADFESLKEQSEAWFSVCDVLHEVRPGWNQSGLCGMDSAVATIRALATSPAPSPVHDSDCSLHNAPALPVGPCDCSLAVPSVNQKAVAKPVARLQAEVSKRPFSEGKPFYEIVILDRDRCFDGMELFAAPSASQGEVKALLTADDVEWVVNDNAELGVKIGSQFFFLYKGDSLVYESGKHDDGTPMMWRPVGKREFGECCYPVKFYKEGASLPRRYTDELVYTPGLSFGKPGDCDWRTLPAAPSVTDGEDGNAK